MTTIVLQAAGSAVGTALGGPMGGMIGRAAGAAAGGLIDQALFGGGSTRVKDGPRLTDVGGLGSTEGAPIPRVYGRVRIGGELIWATRFEEAVTDTVRKDKKSGKGGGGGAKTVTRTYSYFGNFAVGLCEGPVSHVRRIWADGKLVDRAGVTVRVHAGHEDQMPDPLIAAKEGAHATPAFRGTAYVLFERFPLAEYGNRIPQFTFEVVRTCDGLARKVQAMNLIPGAGEFAYEPQPVSRDFGNGNSASENRHELSAGSDWQASVDAMQTICPAVRNVALVVSWFGDDLRAEACTVRPRVDLADKATAGAEWAVAGLDRWNAGEVSRVDGKPAYGGTPSDSSVIHAIRDLKARGLGVTLYPFCMMDVPAGNGLPDPWTGAPSQPAYPWRGRVTCMPAPGRPGSPDGTAAAGAAVAQFFGTATARDFAVYGETVRCGKPDEWSWRRLVLHCAALARIAGGVDAIMIGSELVSLTRVASAPGVFPAAGHLASLAAEVKAMLPGVKTTYAADWTEYGGYSPAPGELRFPLDPLWASPALDAVGIDVYWPISDWRDGPLHLDAGRARGPNDPSYLRAGVASGEGFDWYYADAGARMAQRRTPITDGAYGKPWVWRVKDLAGWWGNAHVERVGGVELARPTAWAPRTKPIWFTELGCPAVDKGANGPNVFPDPKSSENALPPFSLGYRDDLAQTRMIEATLAWFADVNPVSPVYGGPMVDMARIYVWAWDARPFPAFPAQSDVWADAANWRTGHWVTGRFEGVPLDRLVAAVLSDADAPAPNENALDGFVDGCVIDRPMSARSVLEPLAEAFAFDAVAAGGGLRFRGRGGGPVLRITQDDLVPGHDGALIDLVRAQETELPCELKLGFIDGEWDYKRAGVSSRRLGTGSRGAAQVNLAVVTTRAEAQRIADIGLHEMWAGRETARFRLRPGLIGLEIGDVVELPVDGGHRPFRIVRTTDRGERVIEARSTDPSVYFVAPGAAVPEASFAPKIPGKPLAVVVDLPVASGSPPVLQALAVHADPWPGGFTVHRSADGESYSAVAAVDVPALIGTTTRPFGPGPLWRWDDGNSLTIALAGGTLAAGGDLAALSGESTVAILGPGGRWEVVAFARAELIGERIWRLTRLMRGLGGSEAAAGRSLAPGARVVMLDGALVPLAKGVDAVGETRLWRVSPAARDHADPAAVGFEATVTDAALRPLSPVRATAKRRAEGVTFTWIRRARTGGDGWGVQEIALDEPSEAYAAELISGGTVRRSFSLAGPELVYPTAEETADFGGPQAQFAIRIAQVSPTVGPGAWLEAVVPVV